MTKKLAIPTAILAAALWLLTLPCLAQGGFWAGWQVDFSDGSTDEAVTAFVKRATGEAQPSRLINEVKDGVLNLGGKFDDESFKGSGDYASIEWRDINQSIKDLPILKIRWQIPAAMSVLILPTYSFEDGSTASPYFSYGPTKGDGFETISVRIAGDSSLPRKWTPRKLLSLSLWVQGAPPAGDKAVKLDYVGMQPFDLEQEAKENEWVALMKDYKPTAPKSMYEFFPFGIYGFHYARYGEETCYSTISRHHMNFAMDVDVKNNTSLPESAGLSVSLRKLLPTVEKMGVKIGLRARRAEAIYGKSGAEAARNEMRPLIELAAKSKAVYGYDVGDEPSLDRLHNIVAAKKVIEEIDPTKPSWVNFWDLSVLKSYTPYCSMFSTDLYPIASGASGLAEEAYTQCRTAARENDNKPQIAILQAFGMRPWLKEGYHIPSREQVRLQTYAALAGGASGLVWYCYDNYVPNNYLYTGVIDAFGNPDPMFDELTKLSGKLLPICYSLLGAPVDLDAKAACDNDNILVGVRRKPGMGGRFVLVANKSLKQSQSGSILLPEDWTTQSTKAYDLISLKEVPTAAASLPVASLEPGDGRIYFVGSVEEFRLVKQSILSQQVRETLRAQMPDLAVAQAYKADTAKIVKLRSESEGLLTQGKTEAARARATEAGKLLDATIGKLSEYTGQLRRLTDSGALLGSIELAMYPENPKWGTRLAEFQKQYWDIQKQWSDAYEALITGGNGALGIQIDYVSSSGASLVSRVRAVIGSEGLY